MAPQLEDRRILVTGASAGIGAAIARAIAAAGGRVGLLARRRPALEELAAELGAVAVPADVTDPLATRLAVDRAAEELGGLDGLINAAGVLRGGPIATTDPQAWRELFDVNVLGLLHATQATVGHLVAEAYSDVVNVSSMSGRRLASTDMAAYAASKAAVDMLSEGARRELAADGVRVSLVAPGFVRTDLFGDRSDPLTRRLGDRADEVGLDPEQVAASVVHVLASPPGVVHPEVAILSVEQ